MTQPRRAGRPKNPIKREDLLSVAQTVFAESGYAGARVDEIAKRAGIRRASLFHHFSSKEALYLEALAAVLGDLAALVSGAGDADRSFLERLDDLGDRVTLYLGRHPDAARLILRELVGGGPLRAGPAGAVVHATVRAVATLLEGGMDTGDLPHQDPAQLSMSIIGVHLIWFATPDITARLTGAAIFADEALQARSTAVRAHVRALCGVSP